MTLQAHPSYPSSSGFPSDTNLLVDACIARVREAARLDDDAVLPPLPVVTPRRPVVVLTKSDQAGIAASARARDAERTSRDKPTTLSSARVSRKRPSRFPMMICGFVAGAAACIAFLSSPAGHRPSVERARDAASAHASHAAHATASFFTR